MEAHWDLLKGDASRLDLRVVSTAAPKIDSMLLQEPAL